MFERFGLKLSDDDIDNVILDIQAGCAVLVDDWEGSRSAYLYEIKDVKAIWIYDSSTEEIVTTVSIAMYGGALDKKIKRGEKKKKVGKRKRDRKQRQYREQIRKRKSK